MDWVPCCQLQCTNTQKHTKLLDLHCGHLDGQMHLKHMHNIKKEEYLFNIRLFALKRQCTKEEGQ